MGNDVDDYGRVLAAVREELSTRFENLEQNDAETCAAEIIAIVRNMLPKTDEALKPPSGSFVPTHLVTPVRDWKRWIPAGFLLVAWFVGWLLLFGLDRRSWSTAALIGLAATVALAAVVWIWAWLERSFGG